VVTSGPKTILLECKFSVQNTQYIPTPEPAQRLFGAATPIHLITFGGELRPLKNGSYQVPIQRLRQFLLDQFQAS